MRDFFFLLIGLAFIGGCIYLFLQKPVPARYLVGLETGFPSQEFPSQLKIDGAIINIEIADTDEERNRGLSGRESLSESSGMLFTFDKPGLHGIWMKDMKFPIDIAWIDAQKTVIGVEKNVSPDTFPQVFYPPSDALYVLEVSAGTFEKNHIDIGETVYSTD